MTQHERRPLAGAVERCPNTPDPSPSPKSSERESMFLKRSIAIAYY